VKKPEKRKEQSYRKTKKEVGKSISKQDFVVVMKEKAKEERTGK